MRPDLRLARFLPVTAALALLAGCSGGSPAPAASSSPGSSVSAVTAAPSPSSSASSSPTASAGLQTASADEILAQARSALLGAGSVHAKGVVRSADVPYRLDLQMVRKLGAVGSVAQEGTSLGVVRVKDVAYVQPDEASWRAVTGSDATARQFAGKYLKVSASNSEAFKPFLALTDLDQVFNTLLSPTGTVTKGAMTTINGHKVLDLRIDGGRTGDVYVALDGRPYPVRLAYGRGGAQRVDLDRFGRKVELKAPPSSKIASA